MKSQMSNEQLITDLENWCENREIDLCVAYGSRARGDHRDESDLDLALWLNEDVPAEVLMRWMAELRSVTGLTVQIAIVSRDLDPVLAMEIAREAVLVFERKPDSFITARVRLWQAYQDALPFLRAARRDLSRFAAEVRDGS